MILWCSMPCRGILHGRQRRCRVGEVDAVDTRCDRGRHLRCGAGAHPQIREIAIMLLEKMQAYIPILFDDFKIDKHKRVARTDILPAS